MSEFNPLLNLPLQLTRRSQPVALRKGQFITATEFLRDVGQACAALREQAAADVALYTQDTYLAAVWLIAALCENKPITLPGEATTSTLAALRAQGLQLLGDLPGALRDWADHVPLALPPRLPAEARIIIHTSGSSGAPQQIIKTAAHTGREAAALEQALGTGLSDDVIIAGSVPHQHLYGLSFRLMWPLCNGHTLLAQALPGPETLWSLPPGKPAVFITSPAVLKRLPDTLDWPSLPRLQCVLSAGSALPPEAARDAAHKLGCPVSEIYGSSETGAIALRRGPDAPWQALPDAAWRIAETGEAAGCLALRAPWLADDDWFQSSDRAEVAGDSFRLCGRSDRLAKIEDKRISLSAIEAALCALPEISEAGAVVLQGRRSEIGAVLVLSASGADCLATHGKGALDRRLRAALASHIEPLGLPRRWRYLKELPLNSMGKITEQSLQACFATAPRLLPAVLGCTSEAGQVCLRLDIAADLAHFEGHFPATPILPGVAQLDWAMHFARQHFSLPPDCLSLEVIKFQQVIRPGQQAELQLGWDAAKGKLSFEYRSGEQRHASGRFVLGQAEAAA